MYLKKDSEESAMDVEITMNELVIVLDGARNTATGEDQLSYIMFKELPIIVGLLKLILHLLNKIWDEGKMPKNGKTALI